MLIVGYCRVTCKVLRRLKEHGFRWKHIKSTQVLLNVEDLGVLKSPRQGLRWPWYGTREAQGGYISDERTRKEVNMNQASRSLRVLTERNKGKP